MRKKIVIIGAGFGGAYAADYLADAYDVQLVNPDPYFTFTPLLHEVATGTLRDRDIKFHVHSFLSKRCDIIVGRAVELNTKEQVVHLNDGSLLSYDVCLIATGGRTRNDLIKGSEKALGLKSVQDALAIRKKLIDLISSGREPIYINVIGGGFTGLELVCELDQLLHLRFNKHPRRLSIFERTGYPLEESDPFLATYIAKRLRRSDILFEAHSTVKEIEDSAVVTEAGAWPSDITILAAGIQPNTDWLAKELKDERGNIIVEPTLQVVGLPNVFAIGDIITIKDGTKPPMLAQLAIQQAKTVARNIQKFFSNESQENYRGRVVGVLISLGTWNAAGRILGLPIYGRLAWYMWRTVYLFKTPGLGNRLRIAWRWTLYLFQNRGFLHKK